MAVIEIAKIQVRRGQENQTGVPQLDGGEFAWAADAERLYIGLRREDGGSRDANVEILTENHLRNLFNAGFAESTYIYRNGTGITSYYQQPVEYDRRTVQNKLDDFVSIKDFGAIGDGQSWDLAQIQNAIDRLYLNSKPLPTHPRKKLHFPAGNYLMTGTLYIPAYTSIIGDGPGKTIFTLTTGSTLFKTCDLETTSTTGGGETNGIAEIYHYRTFDSLGFTSGATAAHDITIEDVTLTHDPIKSSLDTLTLLSLDCADNAIIRNVEFKGLYFPPTVEVIETPSQVINPEYLGLKIRGTTDSIASGLGNGAHNAVIDRCQFRGLYHGILSNDDIHGTKIQNSQFTELVRGITFNDLANEAAVTGPNNVKILNNYFFGICLEGIYVGENNPGVDANYITSQNNHFVNVGTRFGGNENESRSTPVITFRTEENISVNDRFDRLRVLQTDLENTETHFLPLVNGIAALDNVSVSRATIDSPGITTSSTSTSILRLPLTAYSQQLNVKYNVFQQVNTTASVTVSVATGTTIELNTIVNILPGAHVSGTNIVPGTVVNSVTGTSIIIDTDIIEPGVQAGDVLSFSNNIGRLGNIAVSVQPGTTPAINVVDNYNYIDAQSELVQFDVKVNSAFKYYDVYAVNRFPAQLSIEMQTRIMY